jgi:hypothetical protein
MGPDGVMPEAKLADGTLVAGIYDLSVVAGYGGAPGRGNTIIMGNIGPGAGVWGPFGDYANFGKLKAGDSITFTLNGRSFTYQVVVHCVAPRLEIVPILEATSYEALTLSQAIGFNATFGQQYIRAERTPNSVPRTCPVGQPFS